MNLIVERAGVSYRRHPVLHRRVPVLHGGSPAPALLLAELEPIARDQMAMAEVKLPDGTIATLPRRAVAGDDLDVPRGILAALSVCAAALVVMLLALNVLAWVLR
jgi:hypothetical protein